MKKNQFNNNKSNSKVRVFLHTRQTILENLNLEPVLIKIIRYGQYDLQRRKYS